MSAEGIIIIGAGHAGLNASIALRAEKHTGTIQLLSEEADLPYHRPPLSKTYIKDDVINPLKLLLRPEKFYAENNINLHLETCVRHIHSDKHAVELVSGKMIPYEKLVIATGTRPRPLDIEGIELKGVESLRSLKDASAIREQLKTAKRVLVIGGGFIGLELAATAASMDKQVTVLEAGPRILGRSVAPIISDYVLDLHRQSGIDILLNTSAQSLEGDQGKVSKVISNDGSSYDVDFVIVGIGALPNSELAEEAGIICNNGIVVDNQMRTSNPDIFAIGDCAQHENTFANGNSIRLESVQNANDQARIVAKILTNDQEATYNAVPWFWSDQGSMKLQMTGLSFDASEYVIRGNISEEKFSVMHYRGTELIAADSINMPLDHLNCRKLLAQGISPAPDVMQDTSIAIKNML